MAGGWAAYVKTFGRWYKMQARLDRIPDATGIRRQTVRHAFGTLKARMGETHFLTGTLHKDQTK